MDDLYRENILDHYRNPRNAGHIEHPSATASCTRRMVNRGVLVLVLVMGCGRLLGVPKTRRPSMRPAGPFPVFFPVLSPETNGRAFACSYACLQA